MAKRKTKRKTRRKKKVPTTTRLSNKQSVQTNVYIHTSSEQKKKRRKRRKKPIIQQPSILTLANYIPAKRHYFEPNYAYNSMAGLQKVEQNIANQYNNLEKKLEKMSSLDRTSFQPTIVVQPPPPPPPKETRVGQVKGSTGFRVRPLRRRRRKITRRNTIGDTSSSDSSSENGGFNMSGFSQGTNVGGSAQYATNMDNVFDNEDDEARDTFNSIRSRLSEFANPLQSFEQSGQPEQMSQPPPLPSSMGTSFLSALGSPIPSSYDMGSQTRSMLSVAGSPITPQTTPRATPQTTPKTSPRTNIANFLAANPPRRSDRLLGKSPQ